MQTRRAAAAQAVASTESGKDAGLAATWQSCSTLPFAAGSLDISPSSPLRVFYNCNAQPTPGLVTFPLTQAGEAVQQELQRLFQAATPSPFGKGKKTVHDPSVRTAVELKAAQLGINQLLPPPEVLDQVRLLLQPNAPSVVAELDKLNIYGPGGFFKPHYDTPRSGDHFGTLIICLPSPFVGGQLVLRHVDHNRSSPPLTKTFDWVAQLEQGSAAGQGLSALQWAAFYADTEHEVLPVTEGYRITLTYNLKAPHTTQDTATAADLTDDEVITPGVQPGQEDQAPAGEQDSSNWMTAADVSASSALAAELKQLLGDESWHTHGDRLGFVLQHKYCRGLRSLANLSFPQALKGPDRVLFAALQQAGLEPWVVPLFLGWGGSDMHEESWQDCLADMEEEGEPVPTDADTNFGRPLQPAQQKEHPTTEPTVWQILIGDFKECAAALDNLSGGMCEDMMFDGEESANSIRDVFGAEVEDIAWVTPVLAEHFTYHSSVLAGANEAYQAWFYSTAAILVNVPAWKARRAGSTG